jgi:hypothetical protein
VSEEAAALGSGIAEQAISETDTQYSDRAFGKSDPHCDISHR